MSILNIFRQEKRGINAGSAIIKHTFSIATIIKPSTKLTTQT